MSTKVYNGYRLTTSDLGVADKIIREFKSKARPLFIKRYYSMVANICAELLEAAAAGTYVRREGDYERSALYTAWNRIEDRYRAVYSGTSPLRDPLCDFDAHITLLPSEGCTLALLYCEERAFPEVLEVWQNLEGVEYFGYWDNTDPDEDCTEEEWAERKRLWSEDSRTVPAVRGYSTETVGIYGLPVPTCDVILPLVQARLPSATKDDLLATLKE